MPTMRNINVILAQFDEMIVRCNNIFDFMTIQNALNRQYENKTTINLSCIHYSAVACARLSKHNWAALINIVYIYQISAERIVYDLIKVVSFFEEMGAI